MPAGVAYPTRPALGCSGYQIFIVGVVPLGLSDSSENSPHPPAPSPKLGEGKSRSDGGEGWLAASAFSFSLLSRRDCRTPLKITP